MSIHISGIVCLALAVGFQAGSLCSLICYGRPEFRLRLAKLMLPSFLIVLAFLVFYLVVDR